MMEKIRLKNNLQAGVTVLPNEFIDQYMLKADGEYVKIYLLFYRLNNQGSYEGPEQLADMLELTQKDVIRAFKYWIKEGLLDADLSDFAEKQKAYGRPAISVTVNHEKKENPVHSLSPSQNTEATQNKNKQAQVSDPSDLTAAQEQKPLQQAGHDPLPVRPLPEKQTVTPKEMEASIHGTDLEQLIYMVETYIGRPLSQNEVQSFHYISSQLHFSAELLEYLVEYCVTKGKKSVRYMESVAINWYQKNIETVKMAKEESIAYTQNVFPIMKAFGISNRNLAPAELNYVRSWNQMGFDTEILLEACNRTMLTTHQVSFPYANRILESWKKAGIRNKKDIEALDQKHRSGRSQQASDGMTGSVVFNEEKKGTGNRQKVHKPTGNAFHNFEQRSYDYDDLEAKLQGLHK